jgi:predicted ATPase/DNA-binding CsgD family transcriptional regulator
LSLDCRANGRYGADMGGGRHGLPGDTHSIAAALTSFVGRESEVDEVARLLGEYRMVTVTGPGGVGKTRLAGEVARRVGGQLADGAWLVELAVVRDPALVAATVAASLGVQQAPGVPTTESLAMVLAHRQLLLVLDNCEHVLTAVAELCATLLPIADDLRILTTSRGPIGVAGETRYRLQPLPVPSPDLPRPGMRSLAAAALFADRARLADPHFTLDDETADAVARLVTRLDGMPLAIELAAARVEALGLAQLLDRLERSFGLLTSGDRAAPTRHKSLAATVDWSYRLLTEPEQQVFRRLAVFPGPFSLDAAAAVAGAGAESVVLHLVDCSLLTPPRTGPDGQARYLMLETLRAFGFEWLVQAGEFPDTAAALARYALKVADQAAAAMLASGGELAAARWLAAEDVTVHQALTWALEHDPPAALRLAVALAPWWPLQGRLVAGQALLQRVIESCGEQDRLWPVARFWLGRLATIVGDYPAALTDLTAACDALGDGPPSREHVDALAGRSVALRNLGRLAEAADDCRRALRLARQISYPAGEAMALSHLSLAAGYEGDLETGLDAATQAHRIDHSAMPDKTARLCAMAYAHALIQNGQTATAQQVCAEALAQAQTAGDVGDQANFLYLTVYAARRGGHIADAGTHLRQSIALATQSGDRLRMIDNLDDCGYVCTATGRWADAVTLWTAYATHNAAIGVPDLPQEAHLRQESLRQAARVLGPERTREAQERGAAMTLETAAAFAVMLTSPDAGPPDTHDGPPGLPLLSARERELVVLVAQGLTDARIAGQLYISISTVRSHLDRIRDKTSCRRRAELTRFALQAGRA